MQKLGIISSSSLKTCYNIIFFGSTFTLSYLVMLLFHNIISLIIIFPPDLAVLNYFLYFISFFSSILVLFKVSESVFRLEFFKGKEIIELGSWLYVKIFLILLISDYLPFSIINKITFFIAIFSILFPITISYLKKARISLDKYIILIENITIFTFIGSFLVFFIEVFWNFAINFSFFNENPIILIGTLCVNIFIFLNYCFIKNYYSKRKSKFRLIELFSLNLLLFISLLYIEPLISFIFLFLLYIIIFRVRNENLILRVLNIFLLSYITFLRFYLMFHIYSGFDFSIFEPIPLGFFIIEYLVSLSCVLFFAIILNLKKHFHLEKFILYGSISAISFVFFLTFTNILLLYNITISLGIILFFYSVFLRRIGDKNYHLYKKTLIVLIIFDVISYISYQFLFILPVDDLINNI
ncbi:MAG: oligosaccharide repeat unit polymerase, partial [Candidatus Lokiarchaeota archaeon]|nr:oligosaccharide repeat unit polymerase [Candidatus Lokiarchaeota archaeon]